MNMEGRREGEKAEQTKWCAPAPQRTKGGEEQTK